jgi:1-acyl-sn-glycerol-3-phosphate acyltransferase
MADSRRPVGQASRGLYGVVRAVATILIPVFAKLRTEGIENIPSDGPVILALNHISWFDIPLMSVRVPRITHYMAKMELFQVPLLGGFLRLTGAFPVRRGERDLDALRTAERLLSEGEVIVIFPEGHRSGTGSLGPGHPGTAYIAMRTGVPVVPIGIFGTERTLKGFRFGPFAPRVTVRFGQAFRLDRPASKRDRTSLPQASDQIMRAIAALLPPEYRGVYSDLGSTAQVAGVSAAVDDTGTGATTNASAGSIPGQP